MKRIALFVLGVLAISSSPSAQAPADATATALLALPASVREGATVIKWKPDQTYETLQKGTNGLVCYDRSGFPLQQPFSIECTSMGNLPRVAQNLKAEALGDKAKSEAMLKAAEDGGTRVKPEFGSVSAIEQPELRVLRARDLAHPRTHGIAMRDSGGEHFRSECGLSGVGCD